MEKRKPLNSLYEALTIKPGNDRSRREKHGLISLINMGEMYEIRTMRQYCLGPNPKGHL